MTDQNTEPEINENGPKIGKEDLAEIFEATQSIKRPIQLYIGLTAAAVVLALGVIVLFTDLKNVFTAGDSISLSSDILFKGLLLIFCIYGSVASFTAILKIEDMQKLLVKRVDDSFSDFVNYARPLIEEIIKNRLIQEQLISKLDQKFKSDEIISNKTYTHVKQETTLGREEFLILVSILGTLNVGLFIYLDAHPYVLVPYSLIILALSWWALFALYFKLVDDVRSYYLPAIFVLAVPTLSIVLRAYIDPFKVLYVVFFILYLYIVVMYSYLKYLATGEAVISPKRFKNFISGTSDRPKEPTAKK